MCLFSFMFTALAALLLDGVASLTLRSRSGEAYYSRDLQFEFGSTWFTDILNRVLFATSGDATNLCLDGHIAPELLLYGPARASTSTFAHNFAQSPNVVLGRCSNKSDPGCTSEGMKEMHFFRDWDGNEKSKMRYLAHYPKCTSAKRIVAADLTPGMHVPISGSLSKIAQFYGNQSHQVKFVMLIRKPIDCMQSFYHFEKQERIRSFESYVNEVLANPDTKYMRYLNNILIAESLQKFLFDSPFRASQLTIVPMQFNEAAKNSIPRASDGFWEDLNVSSGKTKEEVKRANYNDNHVPVEEDLKPDTYKKLEALLEKRTGAELIARIIQKASNEGDAPRLYGFRENPFNTTAVREWIESGW